MKQIIRIIFIYNFDVMKLVYLGFISLMKHIYLCNDMGSIWDNVYIYITADSNFELMKHNFLGCISCILSIL